MSVNTKLFHSFILFFSLAFFMSLASATLAQSENSTVAPADFEQLIDSAKDKGLNVIVISPEKKKEVVEDTSPTLTENALKIREELGRILAKAPSAFSVVVKRFQALSPDGTLNWLWRSIAVALGAILIGLIPTYIIRKWNQNYFKRIYNDEIKTRAEKLSFLLYRAFLIAINITILAIIANTIAVVFDNGHVPSRTTISIIIEAYIIYRVFRHIILFNLLAPDTPSYRVINLSDAAANHMQKSWRRVALAVIIICWSFIWIFTIGLNADSLKFIVMLSLLISAMLFGSLAYIHRNNIYTILIGEGEPSSKALWRRLLASHAHNLLILYLAVSWTISAYRILLNLPAPLAIIGAPIIALICALAAYSIFLVAIDRFYIARQKRFEERVSLAYAKAKQKQEEEKAALEAALANPNDEDDDDESIIINKVMSSKELEAMPVFKPIFKPLLENAAGILITIIAFGFILGKWDISVGDSSNPITEFLDTLIIIFVSWFLYRAVVVYIDNQLEEQSVDEEPDSVGEGEMGGQGTSRIGTLLPLVRNVFIVTIVILSFMVILSNAGVDIAPLFAGAGVIGLAVGFGSQALIRDIFSGGFFLFDDAFRKGEYVELGEIRGTVEKISLRSFQLRHHNGPLHTIPFGEIKQLTNYSRDWVMMKLPLRLTYDTDVERVRKLVKKLGQQLLEHQDVGELFLQPLKSQGVYKMEDSAMIIRIKFMTKPGDQFVTRKVVYAAIRDLFEREDIKFANKEVTVRLAEEPVEPLNDEQKKAITAAARSVIDDEEAAAQQPQKKDDGP